MGLNPEPLFAYGTLQVPEVMEAVTGKVWPWKEAKAFGFAQYCFVDEVYPGMIRQQGSMCKGRLYEGLEEEVWSLLDQFEDVVYQREYIEVHVESQTSVKAFAYLLSPQYRSRLSDNPWQIDSFIRDHLQNYLEQCRSFFLAMTTRGHL